jgi:hypothetical protein
MMMNDAFMSETETVEERVCLILCVSACPPNCTAAASFDDSSHVRLASFSCPLLFIVLVCEPFCTNTKKPIKIYLD